MQGKKLKDEKTQKSPTTFNKFPEFFSQSPLDFSNVVCYNNMR